MIPKSGKYYFINYVDRQDPNGSYDGLARFIRAYERDEDGNNLKIPLYEFEHPDKDGKMTLSLFTKEEIILEAK